MFTSLYSCRLSYFYPSLFSSACACMCCIAVFGYGYGQFMLHEHRLMTDLLFNYSSFVRPVLSYDNQMIVNFRLILLNIHELVNCCFYERNYSVLK